MIFMKAAADVFTAGLRQVVALTASLFKRPTPKRPAGSIDLSLRRPTPSRARCLRGPLGVRWSRLGCRPMRNPFLLLGTPSRRSRRKSFIRRSACRRGGVSLDAVAMA